MKNKIDDHEFFKLISDLEVRISELQDIKEQLEFIKEHSYTDFFKVNENLIQEIRIEHSLQDERLSQMMVK